MHMKNLLFPFLFWPAAVFYPGKYPTFTRASPVYLSIEPDFELICHCCAAPERKDCQTDDTPAGIRG